MAGCLTGKIAPGMIFVVGVLIGRGSSGATVHESPWGQRRQAPALVLAISRTARESGAVKPETSRP